MSQQNDVPGISSGYIIVTFWETAKATDNSVTIHQQGAGAQLAVENQKLETLSSHDQRFVRVFRKSDVKVLR